MPTITIRTMTPADVPAGMRLKQQANWNQIPADWTRFLQTNPEGCFLAERDGYPVGTTCTWTFGPVAWVAMVLVDPQCRGQGIGTQLMQHALQYLDAQGVATIRLDATHLGRPIYEKLGFQVDYELARIEGCLATCPQPDAVQPLQADLLDSLCHLDFQVTGTDRRPLLESLWRHWPQAAYVRLHQGSLRGFAFCRAGSRAVQIGPIAACDPEAGRALGDAALAAAADQRVYVDVPLANQPAMAWATAYGLTEQRRFVRMWRGELVTDRQDQLWTSSGPELG